MKMNLSTKIISFLTFKRTTETEVSIFWLKGGEHA